MFEVALLQYDKEEWWSFLGKRVSSLIYITSMKFLSQKCLPYKRWMILLILDLYLLVSSCYNFYELNRVPSRLNSIMENDWKEMLKPALDWRGLGKSNIEHAQIYVSPVWIRYF
jgi:hypothetical protein